MTISDAFKMAASSGYELPYSTIGVDEHKALLDIDFWKSLGKAMGWEEDFRRDSHSTFWTYNNFNDRPIVILDTWMNKWHSFINHLAEGGTVETFFEKLNQ